MSSDSWYCVATEKEIEWGLCWEYCFAGIGGPIDTAYELQRWIVKYGKLYKRLFDDRQQADYALLPIFDRGEIENRIIDVSAFLSEFEGIVIKLLES